MTTGVMITEWIPADEVTDTEYGRMTNREWMECEYLRFKYDNIYIWIEKGRGGNKGKIALMRRASTRRQK